MCISLSTGMHRYPFYWFDGLQGTPKCIDCGYYGLISNNHRAIACFHSFKFCFKRSGLPHMKLLRTDFGSFFTSNSHLRWWLCSSQPACMCYHVCKEVERDECMNRSTSESAGLPVSNRSKKNGRRGRKRVKEHYLTTYGDNINNK